MFHLKKLKNRFRLQISEWNKLAEFLNNLCGGIGIKVQRPDNPSAFAPVEISLDPESISASGTPADKSDDGTVPVIDGNLKAADAPNNTDSYTLWSWNAGEANGFVLDVYCLATKPTASSRYHDLRRCRLTVSRFGTIAKAEMQPDGVRIQA